MRPVPSRSLLVLTLAASASGLAGQSATDRAPDLGGFDSELIRPGDTWS